MDRSESFSVGTLHAAIAGLSPFKAFMLSLVCGILTVFAFAPFYFWPVFILVITLLVWLVDGARTREKWGEAVFMRGWAYGIGFTLASMHWTAQPFLVNPEQHLAFIWMPLILLPAGLGLFFGLGTLLAGRFWSRTPARVFVFATALAFTELLRGTVFGGFPWNWSGMVWEPGSPVSQMASLFGLWGLSALTFLLAAAPAAMADYRR
ncbi:MAG TPA: apolipoprotein N-acyltransferase, partial [Hyphomonadaceae bacterium]|nr:apolipoprotein N-acyltransferase [Hyphomonadaceae bacterium]